MTIVIAVLLYAVLVWGGIRFFRQVHRWDEQALQMYADEQSSRQSKKTGSSRIKRKNSSVPVRQPLFESRAPGFAQPD